MGVGLGVFCNGRVEQCVDGQMGVLVGGWGLDWVCFVTGGYMVVWVDNWVCLWMDG